LAIVIDTGPLVAAHNRRDPDYRACRALIVDATEELVVPAPVLVEFDWLASTRINRGLFPVFIQDVLNGAYRIEDLEAEDYLRVSEILEQYADFDIGFVDAAVLAIVERLGEPKLATLDRRHFGAMKPRHVMTLQLLPG
jgi:predicted nucleic acid-binding protein